MTQFLLPPGFRATDADDSPLAGGYYRFYAAATTTPKAVFSDAALSTSLGTQVNLNSAGAPVSGSNTPVLIYMNTGAYKVELYNSANVLLFTFDNIPGADEEVPESETALPEIPVDSKTTNYTVVLGDRANLLNCNPTGGSFAISLPSAVTMGDNFLVGFKHNGTANQVSLVATGGQSIRGGKNVTSHVLANQGDIAWLLSDGSDWNVVGSSKQAPPFFLVLDRLTAPPASPDPGARYLINGAPTGAWSTPGFADEDIVEADGNGSWLRYTPQPGWLAFDADEEVYLKFTEGQWGPLLVPPEPSTLKTLVVQDRKSSGTVGGAAVETTWTTAVLNTSIENTIDGSSLATNIITLPPGTYRVHAQKSFYTTNASQIRFKTADDDSIVLRGHVVKIGHTSDGGSDNWLARTGAMATLIGEFTVPAGDPVDFVLQYYVATNGGPSNTSLGFAAGIVTDPPTPEVYATVIIEDISAQQGPKGDEGDPGADGLDAGYQYQWASATSGDPGTGKIRTNHATPASVTEIAVHQTDRNSAVLTTAIATWDDSDNSTSRARVRWHKETAPQNFLEYLITGAGTDVGDYWTFPVSYVSSGGSITNGNDIAVQVSVTGNRGATGAAGMSGDALWFNTRGAVALATIDAGVDFIATAGYANIFDGGGATYGRQVSEPSHAGKVQSADGAWWEITDNEVYPEMFGAAPSPSVSTTAWQNAFDMGRKVKARKVTYLIDDQIDADTAGTSFEGAGVGGTQIYQNTLNAKIFNVTVSDVKLSGFTLDYNGTPTSGATAIHSTGANTEVHSFRINRCHKGLVLAGVNQQVHDYHLYSYVAGGVYFNSGGTVVTSFTIDAINSTNGSDGGLVFENFSEGITVAHGNVLNGVRSLKTSAASYTALNRPAYNTFLSVFFDGAAEDSKIEQAIDTEFVGCWFSGGRSGSGYAGLTIGESSDITFVATRFNNCGSHGVHVTADAVGTKFTDCKALGNSVTAGSGAADGFHVAANSQGFQFHKCTAGNRLFAGTQRYGIRIESGNSDDYIIEGCDLRGNGTGGLSDGGSGTDKFINNNHGTTIVHHGPRVGISATGVLAFGSDVTFTHSANRIDAAGLNVTTWTGDFYNTGPFYPRSGTPIPTNGTRFIGMGAENVGIYVGLGNPTLSAPKSSLYIRHDATGTNDRLWINTTGSTTWAYLVASA